MGRLLLSFAFVAALASRAGAETDATSAIKILEKGGKHWSAPAEFLAGETTIVPGKRLLFWPADDEVPDATTKTVTLRFHWLLQPGEKPFKKDQALRLSIHAPADSDFHAMTVVNFQADVKQGMISATLPLQKCECSGRTDLVLYLGLKEVQSNLLQVKVRFDRLATKTPPGVPMR